MFEGIIAKYIRLSLDETQTGSLSIENQRALLEQHLVDFGMDAGEILEFVDNGYTGTNYERPGIQQLLELVRAGRVACILVKDFSRLGRAAIETGYLIERVFPLFRVRLISVTDGFDSSEHEGDTGGMEVAFKLLMSECYSRDLSMKVRSAWRERALRGKALTKNCAFGYRLDEKRKMEIDPEAAETLRIIYEMYAAGKSIPEIAKRLYDEKHPTPAARKDQKRNPALSCVWEGSVLRSILRDEQYLGVYVAGKKRVLAVGNPRYEKVAPEDWIRIPNHHPAIISRDLFDAVQARFRDKTEPCSSRGENTIPSSALRGKVVCGICGHAMQLSDTRNATFHCRFTRSATDAECHGLRILKDELEDVVMASIRRQAEAVLMVGLRSEDVGILHTPVAVECAARMEGIREEKRRLYEALVMGALGKEEYRDRKAAIDAELEQMLSLYEAILAESAKAVPDAICLEAARKTLREKTLTRELVDQLIDKVRVFPDNRVEIVWRLSGFLDCVLEEECSSFVVT